jgi:hypothetical protein
MKREILLIPCQRISLAQKLSVLYTATTRRKFAKTLKISASASSKLTAASHTALKS